MNLGCSYAEGHRTYVPEPEAVAPRAACELFSWSVGADVPARLELELFSDGSWSDISNALVVGPTLGDVV